VIIPLYDQGTVVLVHIPDDVDLAALWQAAEAGSIRIHEERRNERIG